VIRNDHRRRCLLKEIKQIRSSQAAEARHSHGVRIAIGGGDSSAFQDDSLSRGLAWTRSAALDHERAGRAGGRAQPATNASLLKSNRPLAAGENASGTGFSTGAATHSRAAYNQTGVGEKENRVTGVKTLKRCGSIWSRNHVCIRQAKIQVDQKDQKSAFTH